MSFIRWIMCFFGKHYYEDKIRITGPRNEDGLPVCVYQKCKRCNKKGNEVYCYIIVDEQKGGSSK